MCSDDESYQGERQPLVCTSAENTALFLSVIGASTSLYFIPPASPPLHTHALRSKILYVISLSVAVVHHSSCMHSPLHLLHMLYCSLLSQRTVVLIPACCPSVLLQLGSPLHFMFAYGMIYSRQDIPLDYRYHERGQQIHTNMDGHGIGHWARNVILNCIVRDIP